MPKFVYDIGSWKQRWLLASVWPDAGIKINPNFLVLAQKVTKVAFYYIVIYFKIAQKVSKCLGHFSEKICYQELSKIAQTGYTGWRLLSQGVLKRWPIPEVTIYIVPIFYLKRVWIAFIEYPTLTMDAILNLNCADKATDI